MKNQLKKKQEQAQIAALYNLDCIPFEHEIFDFSNNISEDLVLFQAITERDKKSSPDKWEIESTGK